MASGEDALTTSLLDEVRAIAEREMRRERAGHTLQATAVANEAWIRLRDQRNLAGADRGRYLAAAATVVRRVLVEHARTRDRLKRGGPDAKRISLHAPDADVANQEWAVIDLLALDEALDRLHSLNERAFRVVEMRYFAGMANQEIADELSVSLRTVNGDWAFARSWLLSVLET